MAIVITVAEAAETGTPPPGKSNESGMEVVVVTAQKREQRLQDVPISVTVLGGESLDRSSAVGVTEALNLVPGVVATSSNQGGGTQVSMRGVGASGPLFNGSSPIAYYLDSVPFALVKTAIAPDSNAYDLQRVEVLRGPQGTLYGASAQNGVVRVLTHDADLNEMSFKGRASLSTTDGGGGNYRGDMVANVPIVSGKLAARAVVGYQDQSGWVDAPQKNDVNDARIRNLRLKVNAKPTDELAIGLSTWSSNSDYGGPSSSNDQQRITSTTDQSIDTDYDTYALKVDYELPGVSLASMTSYLDYQNRGTQGLEVFGLPPLFTGLDAQIFSQELLLNSTGKSDWRWSAGAFYRDGEDRLRQNNLSGGPPFDYSNRSESYAVFGEIGRRFLENKLEWTLGLRHFHDDVVVEENVSQGLPGEPLHRDEDSFNSTTPRAVLTWYPSPRLSVYGSYSEGFRSGFPQDPGVARTYPSFPSLEPDELHNYEVGLKADVMEGRLAFETALYYIDWQDVQQTLSVPFQGTFVTAVINGQSASGVGIDLAISAHPIDGLDLSASVSWNDLSLDSPVFSGGVQLFDAGDRLNYSSEYTAGASAGYTFGLGASGFECNLVASANYSSEQTSRGLFGPVFVNTGDDLLIAHTSISITSPENWAVTLFVDNINNEDGAMPAVLPVAEWTPRVRPRTMGVQFEYGF